MPVRVTIIDADVFYRPTAGGTPSASHDFFNDVAPTPGWGNADTGPVVAFTLSAKHALTPNSRDWLTLDDGKFVRFKNGGKRLPSGAPAGVASKGVGVATLRDRPDRDHDLVREGDVGPYKKGEGNLYKENLAQSVSAPPPHWTAHNPPDYKTDPKPHVRQRQNRDHQNNQAALARRGDDPAEGIAITIPQWIHMNGYTFGQKAKAGKLKNPVYADVAGQSRTEWIANHPSEALFKEIFHTIRLYQQSNQLTAEIVGSFRYLYKLNVSRMGYAPNADIDAMLMWYLEQST